MPTVEEVATRLSQAKTFTLVDAKDGFWQKRPDAESKDKTTFTAQPYSKWTQHLSGSMKHDAVWHLRSA